MSTANGSAVTRLLGAPRACDASLRRFRLTPPWSVRVQEQAPLTIVAVLQGHAWALSDNGGSLVVREGDVALLRGPRPYTLTDRPATAANAIDFPANRPAVTTLITCTYQLRWQVGEQLLATLPDQLVSPSDGRRDALISYLDEELTRNEPGQAAVLDRLLDTLLVVSLQAWFVHTDPSASSAHGSFRTYGDPIVERAVRLLHDNPTRPWTIDALAQHIGSSRATLARRFTELVGEPPMTYLTGLRLTMAAELLCEPGATVSSVASRVGYATPYGLSAAFKRVRGVSPKQHRLNARHPMAPRPRRHQS